MRKYLLPEQGIFYKANLHCHSTISDGKLTAEEIKEAYKERGYSVVAYTDHDVMVCHNELRDDEFLPLNGYELSISEPREKEGPFRKVCHVCFVALDADRKTPAHNQLVGREYNPFEVSAMMKEGRENGFFVTYNHPVWSMETYEEYSKYSGMNAMEICNFGCIAEGYDDYVPMVYDEILRTGNRIFCISTDDNHNAGNDVDRDRFFDSFGGFTMIKADKLEYSAITRALENGDFYASQAPLIHQLYIEDDVVHITCSPAKAIDICTGRRRCARALAVGGEALTSAEFKLYPDKDVYFRLTVTDDKGLHANTNAYFFDRI